jgi:phage shock protein A
MAVDSTQTRKPLQYQELAKILGPLPRTDQNYVLQFLLAAERRYEHRSRALEQEEHEVRAYRNELQHKYRRKLKKIEDLGRSLEAAISAFKKKKSVTGIDSTLSSLTAAIDQLKCILAGICPPPQG